MSSIQSDRFIPSRRSLEADIAYAKLFHVKSEDKANVPRQYKIENTPYLRRLSECLLERNSRILKFSEAKPKCLHSQYPNLSTGQQTPLRVTHRQCRLPTTPNAILDMPGLRDDFYTNLLGWSRTNLIAVILYQSTYIWNVESRESNKIEINSDITDSYLSALAWNPSGTHLALADNNGKVTIFAVDNIRTMNTAKMSAQITRGFGIGVLQWSHLGLISGNTAGEIHISDFRAPKTAISWTLLDHRKEVCGLALSHSSNLLASGGDDGLVTVWDLRMKAVYARFEAHRSCSKALAWCPWRHNILATGGGANDGLIKLWQVHTAKQFGEDVYTKSQICSMLWSNDYFELVTSHGSVVSDKNDIVVWNMREPPFQPVGVLRHHQARPLHLALSPDQTTLASAGADEFLCMWKCFPRNRGKHSTMDFSNVSLSCAIR